MQNSMESSASTADIQKYLKIMFLLSGIKMPGGGDVPNELVHMLRFVPRHRFLLGLIYRDRVRGLSYASIATRYRIKSAEAVRSMLRRHASELVEEEIARARTKQGLHKLKANYKKARSL